MFAATGILFNHESPRRGETFVSRKITHADTRISVGLQQKLYLGNLEAMRDWGYAPEYVAMWLMLQQPQPDDYVIATAEALSLKNSLKNLSDYWVSTGVSTGRLMSAHPSDRDGSPAR